MSLAGVYNYTPVAKRDEDERVRWVPGGSDLSLEVSWAPRATVTNGHSLGGLK